MKSSLENGDRVLMKFINPLPFVADIDRAKTFYADLLGIPIVEDDGSFVKFANGCALHDGAALYRIIFGNDITEEGPFGRSNLVLYFEVKDLLAAYDRVAGRVKLIHAVQLQAWGQHVFRFYDLDGHIVEVGEPM